MPYLLTLVIGILALVLSAGCTPDNGIVPIDRPGADTVAADRQSVSEEGASGCEDEEEDDTGEYEDDDEEYEDEEDEDEEDEDEEADD